MCSNPDFFQCPAYKLLISDLKSATEVKSTSGECSEWRLTISNLVVKNGSKLVLETVTKSRSALHLDLKVVWIQGKVMKIEKTEGNNFSLVITDDEVNEATVYEYNIVPGGDNPDVKIGAYVGVLGQLWSIKPSVILKPTKVMYLGDTPIHKNMWKDEVAVAKAFLAGLIEPT